MSTSFHSPVDRLLTRKQWLGLEVVVSLSFGVTVQDLRREKRYKGVGP